MTYKKLANDTVTIYNRSGGEYQASVLHGVRFTRRHGIGGGDALPSSASALYFFEQVSDCVSPGGVKRSYASPGEWDALADKSGRFTFRPGCDYILAGDTSGGSVLQAITELPCGAARITEVTAFEGCRRGTGYYRLCCE